MPAPRSPDNDKRSQERKHAEQMFLESKGELKLVEIAERLNLPANKVRKWKSLDDWDGKLHPQKHEKGKKKPVERSTDEKGSVPRKRGAPKGNKNAVGGRGNPHPVNRTPPDRTIHGAYKAVYLDTLDEEEKDLLDVVPKDEEQLLIEQIQLFSIRERRIMQAINKYRSKESEVVLQDVFRYDKKRSFKDPEEHDMYDEAVRKKVESGDRLPGEAYDLQTHTTNKDLIVARLEQELSNVQSKKTKAIETLARIHADRQKAESETAGNEMVKAWVQKVMEGRREHHGEE